MLKLKHYSHDNYLEKTDFFAKNDVRTDFLNFPFQWDLNVSLLQAYYIIFMHQDKYTFLMRPSNWYKRNYSRKYSARIKKNFLENLKNVPSPHSRDFVRFEGLFEFVELLNYKNRLFSFCEKWEILDVITLLWLEQVFNWLLQKSYYTVLIIRVN